jgi:branched-chain amino acid transport system substrate-binding protein
MKKRGGVQMEKRRLGMFILLALILALNLSFSPCVKSAIAAEKEVKIGALMGLTGPGSDAMGRVADGIKAAAGWVNEKGGLNIKGEKYLIKLIGEDYQMSADGTKAAATKLVFDHGVKFMIGLPIPPFKAAASTVTEPNKVLRMDVTGQGGPDDINPKWPYTFVTSLDLELQATGLDHFLKAYPGVKKVGLICPEDPGILFVMQNVKKLAAAHGLTVVAEETYPFGTSDFYPTLTKIFTAKPDALVSGAAFPPWLGGILKQGRELGFKGPMLVLSQGADPYVVLGIAGKDFATDFMATSYALKDPEMTPMIKEVGKIIKSKFGVDNTYDQLSSFEAMWILTQAIEKAQSLDPTVVKNSLEKTTKIDTPNGPGKMGGLKTFGINHALVRPFPVVRIMNGIVKHITWFTPELP